MKIEIFHFKYFLAVVKPTKSIFISYDQDTSERNEPPADDIDNMLAEYKHSISKLEEVNPLDFWRVNSSRWPLLAKLAQRVLGVQATSAQCERMFSIAGHIFSPKRRRTGIKLFEKLVFLKLNEDLL